MVLVGKITLVTEETSVEEVTFFFFFGWWLCGGQNGLAIVEVEMAIIDFMMMKTILEVVGSYNDFSSPPILHFWRKEMKAQTLLVANTLPNHKTKVAMVVTTVAVALAVAEGFNCQEIKLSSSREPEKWQRSYSLQQICELSEKQWWQSLAATKKMCFRQYSCVWGTKKNSNTVLVFNYTARYFRFCSGESVKLFNKGF